MTHGEEGRGRERTRRGADGSGRRSSTRRRASPTRRSSDSRRGHAGHAGRAHHHAGRVRAAQPRGRARAGDRDGDGYPVEAQLANALEREKKRLAALALLEGRLLPHAGEAREAPVAGEVSSRRTSRPRCESSSRPSRRPSPPARAGRRRCRPRTTGSTVGRGRGTRARDPGAGRPLHVGDLARWQVKLEEPVKTSYKGIDVYKLTVWTQGPAMLQALNILENADLRAMATTPALRPYRLPGDEPGLRRPRLLLRRPAFPPEEPVAGLLSKEYGSSASPGSGPTGTTPTSGPATPTLPRRDEPVQGPPRRLAHRAGTRTGAPAHDRTSDGMTYDDAFHAGTTSVVAADAEGWSSR